jgi:hypothetical protein
MRTAGDDRDGRYHQPAADRPVAHGGRFRAEQRGATEASSSTVSSQVRSSRTRSGWGAHGPGRWRRPGAHRKDVVGQAGDAASSARSTGSTTRPSRSWAGHVEPVARRPPDHGHNGCRVDDQTTAAPPWRPPELVRIQAPEPDLNKDPLCSYGEAMKRAGEATAVEVVRASQPRVGARVRMPRFDPAEQRCQVRHLVLFPTRTLLFGDGRPASAGSA